MLGNTDLSSFRRNVMETMARELSSHEAEVVGIEILKELVLDKGITEFDELTAIDIASKVNADYAILGSITALDETINVEWRLMDLHREKLTAFYFKNNKTKSRLLADIRQETRNSYELMTSSRGKLPVTKDGPVDIVSVVGNRRVDDEAVLKRLKSKAEEPLNPDSIKEDIINIFGMGYFDDVMADYSITASGRELKFIVKERPYLKKINYIGSKEVGLDKIEEAVTLKENTVIDRVLIKENTEIIKALYAQEGFYLAKVTPNLVYRGPNAELTFNIDEGEEVKVRKITIIGNEKVSDYRIKKLMDTKKKGFFSLITSSGKFDEFKFHNDLNSIMSHYFDNGYIQSDIIDQSVQLSEDKRWFYITISVTEGEQFTVGRVDVSGDILNTRAEILEKFKFETSEIFNRSKLTKGIETVDFMYGDEGYANAEITPRTKLDEEKRTIDLDINIKKNDLVYIERIDISGNTRTRDKVIRREIEVSEGDLYSSSGLKRSNNNLRRLGFFDDVRLLESEGSLPEKLKLDVDVKERPTGAVTAGMGFSSVDKLIFTASISQANLLGTAIKFELSGTVSANSNKYVLGFTQPWLFDKPISAGFDLYNTTKEFPDFNMNKQGGTLRFGFPLYKRSTRGYLTYKYEDVDISNISPTASNIILEQEGTTTVSSVRAFVKHDTRNDAFFPTEGTNASASIEYAGGILGGNTFFAKYETTAIKYLPMPWDTVFSIRGMFGFIHSFEGRKVPIYERYFLGGISTLRGFKTREVGPKDATGEFIGGETMVVVNLEYIFPLFNQKNFRGVAFYDTGNAYDGIVNLNDRRHGAGVGLRWFSPMGPIRLELGFNLDPRDSEETKQWEFALGASF
jgi:outer membrane protein insertion porin family